MPRLAEEEEAVLGATVGPRASPPSLPPAPLVMSTEQTKRRHIMNSLVQSENNYLASLERLINDYKTPLEESNPPILGLHKVNILFYRVPEIVQCHAQFRIALTEAIKNWDTEEKLGDVFVAAFSKSMVLEIYSDFINNFTDAMECAKSESKRKLAFADFLKIKQITAQDRLNFFGLMVKPIQRFPQFIMLLQDLLKETPPGHNDRMPLQLALTTLESLAQMLNERKRESEQAAACRDKLRGVSGKLVRGASGTETGRCLLMENDVQNLEFNSAGLVSRSKSRRLLLLNDQVVCVSVSGRQSEVEQEKAVSSKPRERLSLKWACGLSDVELTDGTTAGTLARLTMASSVMSPTKITGAGGGATQHIDNSQAENLAQDMADLMHDFDILSRINTMIGSLKGVYPDLTTDSMAGILENIHWSIRQKDEEMSWVDKCCLQLSIRRKDKLEKVTFQMRSPSEKREWVVELRLAKLALDPNNSPGWDILEQSRRLTTKLPLFVKNLPCYHNPEGKSSEVMCGVSYTLLVSSPTRSLRPVTYVWVNATDGRTSNLRIYTAQVTNQVALKDLGTIVLPSRVRALLFVPGSNGGVASPITDEPLKSDLVWVASDDKKLLLYSAADPERGIKIGKAVLLSEPICLVFYCGQVWLGLANGTIATYRRSISSCWDVNTPTSTLLLGNEPVSALLPICGALYAASGRKVMMIDAWNNTIMKSITVNGKDSGLGGSIMSLNSLTAPGSVSHMAVSGVGLWVAMAQSSTIALYHTESFIHMQDINIASNVSRVLAARDVSSNRRSIFVTALCAAKGLLWVGTNVGIALTIPLPRLEGVPIISGRANISYHAHFGPVRMFLPLVSNVISPASYNVNGPPVRQTGRQLSHNTILEEDTSESRPVLRKQMSENLITGQTRVKLSKRRSSPTLRRKQSNEVHYRSDSDMGSRRASKTLPRGFSLSHADGDTVSVFGLYGDLLNVKEYDCDSMSTENSSVNTENSSENQDLHKADPESVPMKLSRSHPELDTIQSQMSKSNPEIDNITSRLSKSFSEINEFQQRVSKSELELDTIQSKSNEELDFAQSTSSVGDILEKHDTKLQRPRSCESLNLSSWSVASRISSQTTSSSETGSESAYNPSTLSSTTSSSNTPSSTSERRSSARSDKKEDHQQQPLTITTLMGGRGYIQWRSAHVEKHKTSHLAQINNSDAYLVIWDHRLKS